MKIPMTKIITSLVGLFLMQSCAHTEPQGESSGKTREQTKPAPSVFITPSSNADINGYFMSQPQMDGACFYFMDFNSSGIYTNGLTCMTPVEGVSVFFLMATRGYYHVSRDGVLTLKKPDATTCTGQKQYGTSLELDVQVAKEGLVAKYHKQRDEDRMMAMARMSDSLMEELTKPMEFLPLQMGSEGQLMLSGCFDENYEFSPMDHGESAPQGTSF